MTTYRYKLDNRSANLAYIRPRDTMQEREARKRAKVLERYNYRKLNPRKD